MAAETAIALYNSQTSQAATQTGARTRSLTALLRPECRTTLRALVEIVGTVGPAQVFKEERNWANTRIKPQYQHHCESSSNVWQETLRDTLMPLTPIETTSLLNNRNTYFMYFASALPNHIWKITRA